MQVANSSIYTKYEINMPQQLEIFSSQIPEVKCIKQFRADDARGSFVKPFHDTFFKENGIDFQLKESFYSVSKKNTIRGLHFHIPPFAHDKIVFVSNGTIQDIALDLRKYSGTYGKYVSEILSFENNQALFIPKGFAHGFATLSEFATVFYFVSGEYHAQSDQGIHYNSAGIDWIITKANVSERDDAFSSFSQFNSPF